LITQQGATNSARGLGYAWACAIAGAAAIGSIGSLLLFGLFLWLNGFDLFDLNMGWRKAMPWDAGLCAVFFIQHSGMVRKSFRTWLGRAVPSYAQGALYAIVSAAALLLLVICWQPSHLDIGNAEGTARWIIRSVFVASLLGFVWGYRSLRNFDGFGVQAMLSHVRGEQPPANPFSVGGPYRWVRHPFYLSAIIAIWACPTLSGDRLLFDVLWTAWTVIGAKLEERDLAAAFGEPYRVYQSRVPMLVPWLGRHAE